MQKSRAVHDSDENHVGFNKPWSWFSGESLKRFELGFHENYRRELEDEIEDE